MRTITVDQVHSEMKMQCVSSRDHIAFKCPICSTVQSMASMVKAGADANDVEKYIGFSCEGRFSGAGPWPGEKDGTKAATERRLVRGCDWTLGGLFRLHKLEVQLPNGGTQPSFEIASLEEARSLEQFMVASSTEASTEVA